MKTPEPCPDARTAPTLTFRHEAYHAGRALIITATGGRWHWRLDEPNARQSKAYPSHPACKAAARAALGLPVIGESGQHLTAASLS